MKKIIYILLLLSSAISDADVSLVPSSANGYKHTIVNCPDLIKGYGMGYSNPYMILRYEDRAFLAEAFTERMMLCNASFSIPRVVPDASSTYYDVANSYDTVLRANEIPGSMPGSYQINYESSGAWSKYVDFSQMQINTTGTVKPSFDAQMFGYFTGLQFNDRYTLDYSFAAETTNRILKASTIQHGYRFIDDFSKIGFIIERTVISNGSNPSNDITRSGSQTYYQIDSNHRWNQVVLPYSDSTTIASSLTSCQQYSYKDKYYNMDTYYDYDTHQDVFTVSPLCYTTANSYAIPYFHTGNTNLPSVALYRTKEMEYKGYSAESFFNYIDIYIGVSVSDQISEYRADGSHASSTDTDYYIYKISGTSKYTMTKNSNNVVFGIIYDAGNFLKNKHVLSQVECDNPNVPTRSGDPNYNRTEKSVKRTTSIVWAVIVVKPSYHSHFS